MVQSEDTSPSATENVFQRPTSLAGKARQTGRRDKSYAARRTDQWPGISYVHGTAVYNTSSSRGEQSDAAYKGARAVSKDKDLAPAASLKVGGRHLKVMSTFSSLR